MRKPAAPLAALATIMAVLASVLVTAGPAQAYGNLTVLHAIFDMDNCNLREGDLTVGPRPGGGCQVHHSAGGTGRAASQFWPDPNSEGVNVNLIGNRTVGWVEFHPYDELLFIADTVNDGDTIYVEFLVENPDNPIVWDLVGVYRPPGTSSELDFREVDLSITDGRFVLINIFDDAGRTDLIRGGFVGRA